MARMLALTGLGNLATDVTAKQTTHSRETARNRATEELNLFVIYIYIYIYIWLGNIAVAEGALCAYGL